ncbi:3-isopropylmalate dehydratase small subunit [Pseudotabrizicola formosa]|uniref:3-isopropylmalate dehydratase small subunit n=1 Tax=Pseudotabrizicola formosa TaxID=2030009 RepID=UPI000CD00090|nr:3-isopropylmalate dehydratase small subunit [Pseudotabrizicola formosa]
MTGWTLHHGLAAALPLENIDTDQIIPARFMSAPREEGYGRFLLHDLRRDGDALRPDFTLNHPQAQGASLLVARRNFGGGSSREAAVYALHDAGFRVVIAPSFGDIFAANAVNNGLLPARITEDQADRLLAACPAVMTVDLQAQMLTTGSDSIPFALDPVWRQKLINGWDDIDLTASHAAAITAFTKTRQARAPWVWPND